MGIEVKGTSPILHGKQNINREQKLTETGKREHKYKPKMNLDVSKARKYKKGGKV